MTRTAAKPQRRQAASEPLYATSKGRLYHGTAENLLVTPTLRRYRGRIQMVFTSPPFPLNRKKKYGNLSGQEYVDWLASLALPLKDYLTSSGSIVIELGNAWEPGRPVMSTLTLEALLAFKKAGGFHLCQEFICFNPARLPSPAQWVTVKRSRVKDAFTRVWWLSPTPEPRADNRRVLTAYSSSMRRLLERGTYNAGRRPSEWHIGQYSFLADHGGAVPPNVLVPPLEQMVPEVCEVLAIPNTQNADAYQVYCRQHGIQPHPARMPQRLVEFFVEFLTLEGETVLDPFAGSNTTGMVAESRGRKWLAIEADLAYASASAARFSTARIGP